MSKDPVVQKVLDAVQGKPEAMKQLASAMVSRDVKQIRDAIRTSSGIALSDAEVSAVLATVPADPQQALAYCT